MDTLLYKLVSSETGKETKWRHSGKPGLPWRLLIYVGEAIKRSGILPISESLPTNLNYVIGAIYFYFRREVCPGEIRAYQAKLILDCNADIGCSPRPYVFKFRRYRLSKMIAQLRLLKHFMTPSDIQVI